MTEQIEQNLGFEIASRRRRLAAFFIDHIIFSFLASLIGFTVMGPNFTDKTDFSMTFILLGIVMIPIFTAYFSKDIVKGISIGRWIMGIMVRDYNDNNLIPSTRKLIIRIVFLIIWPIELFNLIRNKDKRRLGDKNQNTIVLNNPFKEKRIIRIVFLIFIGVFIYYSTNLLSSYLIKSSDAYETALDKIKSDETLLKDIGGIKSFDSSPIGSINVSNGYGQGAYTIKIIGNDKEIEVTVFLSKEPKGTWTVTGINK